MKDHEKLQEKPWKQDCLYTKGIEARIQLGPEAEGDRLPLGTGPPSASLPVRAIQERVGSQRRVRANIPVLPHQGSPMVSLSPSEARLSCGW